MRVCFLGNFRVPYSSESDYLWTMRERLGFAVDPLQETMIDGDSILQRALDSDAFFWVHTHGWETPGRPMKDVLQVLRDKGVPTIAYHLDLYMPIQRWRNYQNHAYMQVQHFFTVDKLMADWLNENTETKGYFLRPGVVERDCYMAEAELKRDVIFVGSRDYHPEWPYRKQLIDWLAATYGDRFEHWGPHGKGLVRGQDLNRLYAETKVVVGDTLCPGFDYPYYTSDRVYEVLGRGGFLIHPFIEGLEEELTHGQNLICYDYENWRGLKRLIDHYLEHHNSRERIRTFGHVRVERNFTYTNRLMWLFRTVGLL